MNQNDNIVPHEQLDKVDGEEIDILAYVHKFLGEKRLILIWCGIAAILGIIAALSYISTYTVTAKLSPESSQSGNNASLSSLASMAGLNLGGMGVSDGISPDLYPEIVSSVPFLTDLFNMPVETYFKGEDINCNYYEYLVNCEKLPWYLYLLTMPGKVMRSTFGVLHPDEVVESNGFIRLGNVDISRLTRTQQYVINKMRKQISVDTDKMTYLTVLSVTDQSPEVAMKLSQTIVTNLRKFITAYRTEKSREDLKYYEQLYEKAQSEYYDAQQRYAQYMDMNQGLVRQSVKIEQERLDNEMQLKFNLYNSCAQQVQMAKARVQRETPVCTILTPPTMPSNDNESGIMIFLIYVFLGFCLSFVWIIWIRDWVARLKEVKE